MILLIGFPKSGTTSFQSLFHKLGYKSIHWQCDKGYIGTIIQSNKHNHLPLLSGFDKYDCITQMDVCISEKHCYWPQLTDYQQLYYENQDAVFILNKRDPEKILSSFKRWSNYDKRLYKYNPELIPTPTDNGFIELVKKHYNDVETFFSNQCGAKFISYDIENDTLDKLKPYIDTKNIVEFPKENTNIKNTNTQNILQNPRKRIQLLFT
jgi:hypothetical protein